jgi:hypothetical protein
MDNRLTPRREQELRALNPAEHPDIAALLALIDGQRGVIRGKDAKIERQRAQIQRTHDWWAEKKKEIAALEAENQQLREQSQKEADTTATHFTAWLTTTTSALDQDNADVVVLEDEELAEGEWTSTGDPLFTAVTDVPAEDGDHGKAQREATDLLATAGWTTTGSWHAVDTGYVVTVERA